MLLSYFLFSTTISGIRQRGGAGGDWDNAYVHNNLYLLLLRDNETNEKIIFAKFGIKSNNGESSIYDEFDLHRSNFTNFEKRGSAVYKAFSTSTLISYCVYDLAQIDIKTDNNRKGNRFLNCRSFQNRNFIDDLYDSLSDLYDSYGFHVGKLWTQEITYDSLKSLKAVDIIEHLTTALFESCGHMACADVMRAHLIQKKEASVRDYLRFFCCSDSKKNPNTRPYIPLYSGYTYAAEKWAFSNDNEFVCAVFPEECEFTINDLIQIGKQISIMAVSYLLRFINSHYYDLEICVDDTKLYGNMQFFDIDDLHNIPNKIPEIPPILKPFTFITPALPK